MQVVHVVYDEKYRDIIRLKLRSWTFRVFQLLLYRHFLIS
jgi:hypothetical protein